MLGIGATLASFGIGFVKDLISDNGEDLVKAGIEKVTGIDLNKKSAKELTPQEIAAIKDAELELKKLDYSQFKDILADKANARLSDISRQDGKGSTLVKSTGSLIALFTVISAFILDLVILYMVFKNLEVSPILTLIAGANNVKAGQVLSFYFGSSKTEADAQRR